MHRADGVAGVHDILHGHQGCGVAGVIALALQAVTGGLTRALGWATASAPRILAVLLAVALAWGWLGWRGKDKAEKVLRSTEVAWRQAQADAAKAQIAANLAAEARYKAQAEKTDYGYQKALQGANSRSERFIAANRVRACPTGSPGRSDPAAQGDGAQGADGAGESAILVAVKPEDVNICTENTTRLQAAREWALELAD
jgi:type II secretory pathway pseudopilin PulG